MPRSRLMRILLVAASILIIIGVLLMTWLLKTADDRGAIKVLLNGEQQPLKFESLKLVPGQQCEYTVNLEKIRTDDYTVNFDFIDVKEEYTLKNFARVKLVSGDEILYDELLADAFEDEKITMTVDFSEKKNTKFKVIYYLPIDVGNEAKNAEAVFELLLTASNEE